MKMTRAVQGWNVWMSPIKLIRENMKKLKTDQIMN